METFNINTAQNVEISNPIAGVGNRILASALDVVFIGAYVLVVFVVFSFIVNISEELGGAFITLMFLPLMFYNLAFETFFDGQTLGKKIMKIKVIRIDGGKPKFYNYLVRWIFRLIDIYIGSGGIAIITIATTSKAQRLGDIVAGTTVIKLNEKAKLDDTIFTKLNDEYKLHFENANLLNDSDITIIKEVLDLLIKNPSPENIKLSYDTKTQVEKVLKVHTEFNSSQFLNTVIQDYNYLNSKQ